ncbi:MAG: hypothetical protein NVSMB27_32960 [Ktedonobacteraceae bacterium]
MTELALHFEMTKDSDLEQTAGLLCDRLASLQSVQEVAALPEEPRVTGLEVAAAIFVTIQIVHGTRKFVEEIRKLIPEIKGLIGDIKGLKDVTVDVGPQPVPIGKLTEQQVQQLAEE